MPGEEQRGTISRVCEGSVGLCGYLYFAQLEERQVRAPILYESNTTYVLSSSTSDTARWL